MRSQLRERGAAAVEFALILPVLLALVLGVVEFGRAYSVQTQLSGAAREGVRSMALTDSSSTAKTTAKAAASTLNLTDSQIAVTLKAGSTTSLVLKERLIDHTGTADTAAFQTHEFSFEEQ